MHGWQGQLLGHGLHVICVLRHQVVLWIGEPVGRASADHIGGEHPVGL